MQIGQRHFNAHAFVNVAIFLDLQETGSDGHKGLKVQNAHVAFGFDQCQGANSPPFLTQCVLTLVVFSFIADSDGAPGAWYFPALPGLLCICNSCQARQHWSL